MFCQGVICFNFQVGGRSRNSIKLNNQSYCLNKRQKYKTQILSSFVLIYYYCFPCMGLMLSQKRQTVTISTKINKASVFLESFRGDCSLMVCLFMALQTQIIQNFLNRFSFRKYTSKITDIPFQKRQTGGKRFKVRSVNPDFPLGNNH